MQHKKLRSRARHDRVGTALRVAELDEDRCAVESLDDGTHLAACQTFRRQVRQ